MKAAASTQREDTAYPLGIESAEQTHCYYVASLSGVRPRACRSGTQLASTKTRLDVIKTGETVAVALPCSSKGSAIQIIGGGGVGLSTLMISEISLSAYCNFTEASKAH